MTDNECEEEEEEEEEEDGWHSAEDDLSSPALSSSRIQLQVCETESTNGSTSLQDPGIKFTQTSPRGEMKEAVLKLSPAAIHELTSSPKSLPLQVHPVNKLFDQPPHQTLKSGFNSLAFEQTDQEFQDETVDELPKTTRYMAITAADEETFQTKATCYPKNGVDSTFRPYGVSRTVSTPPLRRSKSSSKFGSTQAGSKQSRAIPTPLQLRDLRLESKASALDESMPSPMPPTIPLPPLSLPTYLQLELSSHRPSPLYIHRSATSDFPYESSSIKIERLQNFLLLPPQLEQVLWFGALACLDSWLFSFTILPLRFLKALSMLAQSWSRNIAMETRLVGTFIYAGTGRMWRRRRRKDSIAGPESPLSPKDKTPRNPLATEVLSAAPKFAFPSQKDNENPSTSRFHPEPSRKRSTFQKHRRSKSVPSALLPDHKADILKGLLIIISCTILMYFDASRMYHGIRGQAAIKLYVIYNVLEVGI